MWAYNSVFYQIYPIGFCGAPYVNDGICISRILKIGEWADYLKELGVEIVGETKMKIAIEEDEEPWDVVDDEVTDEDLNEIDNNVNEDYIKKNVN